MEPQTNVTDNSLFFAGWGFVDFEEALERMESGDVIAVTAISGGEGEISDITMWQRVKIALRAKVDHAFAELGFGFEE